MDDLKKLLNKECSYCLHNETMDRFLELVTDSVELRDGEALIPYGNHDNNVYVLKSGIVRLAYFDGLKEMTFAFAMSGTVMISYHSFYLRDLSFFQLEACCDSVVLRIPRDKFIELTRTSHDFSQWIMWMSIGQLWFFERKLAVVNGDAKERLESLMENRPEILEKVQAKIIASYIGVTPQYLSKLKRRLKNASASRTKAVQPDATVRDI